MIQFPVNKYDADHDVLHVYLSERCNCIDSSAEEPVKDIYVLYDDDTDEITGFKILDFKKNADTVRKMYPQYNFVINQKR